ncbi:hypothetical protein [Streptomyces parvus]|uniref:hypothetical protein n=1 Tax=Streptomyces parvus TaxID=66428 RepID=UPI003D7042A1
MTPPRRTRTAAALCAAAALLLTGCGGPHPDPRALPGTDSSESLDGLLNSYSLSLPDCRTTDLRFGGRSKEWGKELLLTFRAPERCINTYLTDHDVTDTDLRAWPYEGRTVLNGKTQPPDSPPFSTDDLDRFGLTPDPGKKNRASGAFLTTSHARFKVFIVPGSPNPTVYLRSTYNGKKER